MVEHEGRRPVAGVKRASRSIRVPPGERSRPGRGCRHLGHRGRGPEVAGDVAQPAQRHEPERGAVGAHHGERRAAVEADEVPDQRLDREVGRGP